MGTIELIKKGLYNKSLEKYSLKMEAARDGRVRFDKEGKDYLIENPHQEGLIKKAVDFINTIIILFREGFEARGISNHSQKYQQSLLDAVVLMAEQHTKIFREGASDLIVKGEEHLQPLIRMQQQFFEKLNDLGKEIPDYLDRTVFDKMTRYVFVSIQVLRNHGQPKNEIEWDLEIQNFNRRERKEAQMANQFRAFAHGISRPVEEAQIDRMLTDEELSAMGEALEELGQRVDGVQGKPIEKAVLMESIPILERGLGVLKKNRKLGCNSEVFKGVEYNAKWLERRLKARAMLMV